MSLPTTPEGSPVLKPVCGTKQITLAATPQALSATDAYCTSILVSPAAPDTQGSFYLGDSTNQLLLGPINLGVPIGCVINLKDHFVKVAADGDSVVYLAYYRQN